MAELGGALGADRLVAGDLAKLGESFLFHLRVVEVRKVRVSVQADRRLRGGTIDDVLDVLPAMVAELFPGTPGAQPPAAAPGAPPAAGAAPPPRSPPTPAARRRRSTRRPRRSTRPRGARGAAPVRAEPLPSVWVEEREDLPRSVRDRLYVLTDDDGLVIALVPFQGLDAPFYAGDGEKLYRQRIVGGGQVGRLAVDRIFWEPRAGAESLLAMRGGKATLTCGKKTIPLRVVGAGGTRRVLAEAEFYAPPFRTVPHLLAPDDQGAYFLVDAARDPETGGPDERPDYRLRYGPQGRARPGRSSPTRSPTRGGLVLVTSSGRLVHHGGRPSGSAGAGRTLAHRPSTSATPRPSSPAIPARTGARLGTPCDGKL